MKYKISVDGEKFEVEVSEQSGGGAQRKFKVDVSGTNFEITAEKEGAAPSANRPNFSVTNGKAPIARPAPSVSSQSSSSQASGVAVAAPMAGKVVAIKVAVGDMVKEGDVVVILEAMKMENSLNASVSGKVVSIHASIGDVMKNGDAIVRIDPEG